MSIPKVITLGFYTLHDENCQTSYGGPALLTPTAVLLNTTSVVAGSPVEWIKMQMSVMSSPAVWRRLAAQL